MQCAHAAPQYTRSSSSSSHRQSIDSQKTSRHAPQLALLARRVCSTGAQHVLSAPLMQCQQQQQEQQQQQLLHSHQQQQQQYTGQQHSRLQLHSSGSSSVSLQRHTSKHSTRSSGSTRLSLQELQQLLRERPASERPVLLTASIKACSSWQQAALLYADHSHEFNHVHTAALISHLPKVVSRQQPLSQHAAADVAQLLADLSQLAEEVLPACGPRELANMAQGLAAGGCYSRRLMQLLLGRCVLAALKPQELANLAWAVAKTGHQVHEGWTAELLQCSKQYMAPGSSSSSSSAQGWEAGSVAALASVATGHKHNGNLQGFDGSTGCFKPQELANLAWALAVMQQQCMLQSSPPLRQSCTRVDAAWKERLGTAAAAQLREFNAADLSMVLWALAVLGGAHVLQQQQQQSWLDGQLGRAAELAGVMEGRHIAVLLWSVSQLQRQHQHTQQQRAQRLLQNSPGSSTTTSPATFSSDALQAFAAAGFPRLQQLLPDEGQPLRLCCVVLLASGHLQLTPPAAALQVVLQAAGQQLQQQCAASWSSMRQQHLAVNSSPTRLAAGAGPAQQWLGDSQQQQQQQGVSLHDVTMLLYSAAKLQYRPNGQFFAAADQAAATACWQLLLGNKLRKEQQRQGQASQQYDYPTIALPAGAAAARPGPAPHVCVKDISLLLWAMGKLRHQPPPKLLRLLYKAAAARMQSASASDVGLMLWGLARLRARPRHTWLQAVVSHFLSRLDDSVAAAPAVCNVVHSLAHLPGGSNLHQLLVAKLSEGQQLQQLAGAARVRFEECKPRELVALLQGFAGLGFSPGAGWLADHQLRCEQLGLARFSEREVALLRQARTVLVQLQAQQQQQQVAEGKVGCMQGQDQEQQGGGLQGTPGAASVAGAAHQPGQQQVKAAVLAALV